MRGQGGVHGRLTCPAACDLQRRNCRTRNVGDAHIRALALDGPRVVHGGDGVPLTALELPGWVEFNAWRTGFSAHPFSASTSPDGPNVRAILYLDGRGRVRFPPNNPFIPVVFHSARQRPSGQTADWLRLAGRLAAEMKRRRLADAIVLPPDVTDVRPWQWAGFLVGVRYTYCLDFPMGPGLIDRETIRHCEKSVALGMTVERVADIGPVMECLAETETRREFSNGIDERTLRAAQQLLGPDSLRTYVCFDARGHAAAARVVAHLPGARAVALMAGSRTASLSRGANYLLWRHSLDDLSAAGATGLDLCGANLPSVAEFKSQWGGRLVPTYFVRSYSARAWAMFVAGWLGLRRYSSTPERDVPGGAVEHRSGGEP